MASTLPMFEERGGRMCNVCCAMAAMEATAKGQVKRFVWDPGVQRGPLANNLDAAPLADYRLFPAEWPFVLVQAEAYRPDPPGPEGPGRFRFGFSQDDMSRWIEVDDLSFGVDMLGVSWGWRFLDEDLQKLILARDKEGILRHWSE